MKTEVKKIDSSKTEISIEAEGDAVKNKFEDVFKKIGQTAKVKGFRPGHVPREILEKEFSGFANEQVLKELIPELYDEALQKEGISTVDLPRISDVKLQRTSLSFKAQVEVLPEIQLKNYKGLKINYKKIAVSADEIKRNIDTLKETRKADIADDNFAKALGYPGLSELEEAVRRQIAVSKDNSQRQEIEKQVIEQLTKELDVKIPQSLADKQLEDLLRNAKMDLAMRGVPKEKIAEQENSLRQELEPAAKNQVKVYLVLSEIAKREKIPSDDHMPRRVMEFLFNQAHWEMKE
jgi:FKBP-type peptidyl-prolyl cis-trans isomerase (trigger factor)